MRKSLLGLLGILGLAGSSEAAPPQQIDPASTLYSTPTLSEKTGALESVAAVSHSDMAMHEDDWRQLEFYPSSRREEVRGLLRELSLFERQHRRASGWDAVFIRKLAAGQVIPGTNALVQLSKELTLSAGAGPVLFYGSSTVTGRVANGFSFRVSDGLALYGTSEKDGIVVLGAQVAGGDLELTKVFAKLHQSHALILVDWRAQMMIEGVGQDGNLQVWRPP